MIALDNFQTQTETEPNIVIKLLYFQEKPYSFNYSILDEETGISHSREESSDDRGVVRGAYKVRQYPISRSVFRSRDKFRPIRGQYSGQQFAT